jgi:hypothetical protein
VPSSALSSHLRSTWHHYKTQLSQNYSYPWPVIISTEPTQESQFQTIPKILWISKENIFSTYFKS